jgi:hypothetical protein
MVELDLIKSKVSSAIDGSPNGRHCHFVKITDKIGAKLYRTKDARDFCYDNQVKAAKHDLGPEVYGKFEFVTEEELINGPKRLKANSVVYGYLSEVVEVAVCNRLKGEEWLQRDNWFNANYGYAAVDELISELDDIGFEFADDNLFNMGIKDGRLICIDFGG